jgi:hypothetical protein
MTSTTMLAIAHPDFFASDMFGPFAVYRRVTFSTSRTSYILIFACPMAVCPTNVTGAMFIHPVRFSPLFNVTVIGCLS